MTAVSAPTREAFRPAMHYASKDTWLNDPNGLIFHDGTYHLYYQNNPFGNVWGNMSWGHATSTDLLDWTEQPVAIACDEVEDIFSGSIVHDAGNTSGFGTEYTSPLVAVYTSAYKGSSQHAGIQAQSLAFSTDGGYTWTKHDGNPVLNRNSPEFRDPKVFRYNSPDEAYWVMVAVEAQDHTVVLYRSHDLKTWDYLSSFGPANATGGVWECPDLFPLPLDGNEDQLKWVLTVNLNPGGPNSGSSGQYFVGHFDGVTFTSETTVTDGMQDPLRLSEYQWLDWGRDYYAAVSFNDAPDGRRLMIAWMNNWQYSSAIPTSPWRSPMSLVREVSLVTVNGQPRLSQVAVWEKEGSPTSTVVYEELDVDGILPLDGGAAVQLIDVKFVPGSAEEFGLIVRGNGAKGTRIGIRPGDGLIHVDRTASGNTAFHESFASMDTAPLQSEDGTYSLRIFVDHCSVEVFAQDGQVTLTELIFPAPDSVSVSAYATGGSATVPSLELTSLA